MANVINTRIQLKYDTLAQWTEKNPLLLAGELAIVTLGNSHTDTTPDNGTHPVLFKVGPGNFNSLPWASGLAADVYAWAKKKTPDWNDFPKLPLEVIDEGTGKFVTDFTYADNKLTITRDDAVNTLTAADDDVVILTTDKSKGDVAITANHAEAGKAGTTTDANGDATTAGSSVTIKIPTLSVDKYGHTQFNGETSHTITIPGEVAVGDGNVTIEAGKGLTTGGSFNVNQDGDSTITINHEGAPALDDDAVTAATTTTGSGKTFISAVKVDDMGHVAGVETVVTSFTTEANTASGKAKFTYNGSADAVEFVGTSNVKVSSDAAGKITIDDAHDLSKGEDETTEEATQLTYGGEFTVMVDTTVDGHTITDVLGTFKLPAAITAADLGLESAMHFVGALSAAPDSAKPGDVYLNTATKKEYVYDESNGWVELGDEGSHALKNIKIEAANGVEITAGGTLAQDTKIELTAATRASLALADSAVQPITLDGYKTKQNPLDFKPEFTALPYLVTEVTQNANGEIDVKYEHLTHDLVAVNNTGHASIGFSMGGNRPDEVTLKGDDYIVTSANSNNELNIKATKKLSDAVALAETALQPIAPVADQALSGATVVKGVAQAADGKITVSTRTLTPADIGAQPAGNYQPAGDYKIKQTAYTYTKGAEKIITKIEQNANGEIAVTEGSLTTDDIAGGTETWFFYCGTATEVMDTKPTV